MDDAEMQKKDLEALSREVCEDQVANMALSDYLFLLAEMEHR